MPATPYFHVDVFGTRPLTGNGLAVFVHTDAWSAPAMQALTQEMKQFESIFLSEIGPQGARARVFTVEEELPFAGHPVLGAAVVLHRLLSPEAAQAEWVLQLPLGPLTVRTQRAEAHHRAEMNQGRAAIGEAIDSKVLGPILAALGLGPQALVAGLAARVMSTGLPYLVLPVQAQALDQVAFSGQNLEPLLAVLGAKFVFLLDPVGREVRTWDNLGRVEDVATGSAAGPAAAYLWLAGLAEPDAPVLLAQGRFAGRASQLQVRRDPAGDLWVSGEVWPMAQGTLEIPASELQD
ncbi:PhzF family phenazine biosynthesis protein [Inhella inkyongensis]|uniref:PhzF family phenazine biosynthesis protein n=1 Tax=Inhella inkyongensis TaxID=392593 RepID=A0A840SBA1_9BURK|nr:PhzF family phenazine biosynthesis protein [Inhella inkyongensis]MBB5206064.1 PhzF family phenazine biosynthesis protein [Inhella inkyongensis]